MVVTATAATAAAVATAATTATAGCGLTGRAAPRVGKGGGCREWVLAYLE